MSELWTKVVEVENRFKTARDYSGFLEKQLVDKHKQKSAYEAEYKTLLEQVEIDKKAVEVIKVLTERVSAGGLSFVQDLVTRGLRSIFIDDAYSFVIEMSERGANKVVEFYIVDSRDVKTPLEDCGGGIQVVVSFIIRVYMIIKLGLVRLLVLDEVFSQLSIQYAEGLLAFMQSMVDQLGFHILWVSHNSFFVEKLEHVYEVSKGRVKLLGK